MIICKKDECTGCGACISICSKSCIKFEEDIYGTLTAAIDEESCIKCGRCLAVCPNNNKPTYLLPTKTYASWSTDKDIHKYSASGGIAAEIYKYAIDHDIFINGVFFERNQGVFHKPVRKKEDITWARDSKYVFSDMGKIYKMYEERAKSGEKSIFIGLPCQVAGIRNYFCEKKLENANLLLVELICHGVPNWKFLDAHISFIEGRKKAKVDKISFRDNTGFVFKAFGNGGEKLLYWARMHEGDQFYRSFALNLDFRENCYNCKYARKERIADITLGDFSGLGREQEFNYPKHKISVVLAVTQKGRDFLNKLCDKNKLALIEREYPEAYLADGNPNLRHPSIAHKNRDLFLEKYKEGYTFDQSVRFALEEEFGIWRKQRYAVYAKRFVKRYIPKRIKKVMKKQLKGCNYEHCE